jgi:hypothetical protein
MRDKMAATDSEEERWLGQANMLERDLLLRALVEIKFQLELKVGTPAVPFQELSHIIDLCDEALHATQRWELGPCSP